MGKRILIVDGETDLVQLRRHRLQPGGYEVEFAPRGRSKGEGKRSRETAHPRQDRLNADADSVGKLLLPEPH